MPYEILQKLSMKTLNINTCMSLTKKAYSRIDFIQFDKFQKEKYQNYPRVNSLNWHNFALRS